MRLDPATTRVHVPAEAGPGVVAIGERLAAWLGLPRVVRGAAAPSSIAIVLEVEGRSRAAERDPGVDPPADTVDESYHLEVMAPGAVLRAPHEAGLFQAARTLAALAGVSTVRDARAAGTARPPAPSRLPFVSIDDAPQHPIRAMHLDVARHFFDRATVERYVDWLSFYRFNVLHWHLTDDQAFRFPSKSHPELVTDPAAAYGADDIRAVVAYARERFVTVVPEIDVPGHTRAVLAKHPELSCTGKALPVPTTFGVFEDILCAGNPASHALMADVLADVTDLFPSRLLHLGGDEVPKTRWNACPRCRARMAREKLTPAGLQGAFLRDLAKVAAARGRRTMAWDDAVDGGFVEGGVVVAWQSAERGLVAASAGHDVIMAPYDTTYFNYWQSRTGAEAGHEGFLPWTRVRAFSPVPRSLQWEGYFAKPAHPLVPRFLGGEAALWTEYVRTEAELEQLLLPRLAALSDALWTGQPLSEASERPGQAMLEDFAARFTAQRPALDAAGARYFVEPPVGLRAGAVFLEETALTLERPLLFPDGVIRYTLDGKDPDATSPIYERPLPVHATTEVKARLFLPAPGPASPVVRGKLEKLTPSPALPPGPVVNGVKYTYYEGEHHELPDFARLVPSAKGVLPRLAVDVKPFRKERFAVVFDALLVVPATGVFRFVAEADDGVAVEVDGRRVLVDDGEHPPREADGDAALAAGAHAVRILYFQGGGGKSLGLRCSGPGLPEVGDQGEVADVKLPCPLVVAR